MTSTEIYQKALDNVKRVYVESEHYDEEDINLLQELVCKATPKKVDCYRFDKHTGNCPRCNITVFSFMNKYCQNCGQALDWSDEDDK